jgi:hypothetical protein
MTEKRIRIIIDSKQAEVNAKKIDKHVKGVGKSADNSGLKFNKLALAIKGAIIGGALGKAITTLVSAQREFDKLNASLVTATGSTENAGVAFDAIQKLASETPFAISQVTEAFIKLRNLGLDPSEDAIISYGNTAAAMGKDLSQLIEAVADATTGEFERLKEFGIKARNEGDQIALTFQGTTRRVENSADAIENYLKALGQNEFAGAINERLKTLDGSISNLDDAWSTLVRTVSDQGVGSAIQDGVIIATEAIAELTAAIDSGQLPAYFSAWTDSFKGFASDFTSLANGVAGVVSGLSGEVAISGNDISGFLSDAFLSAGPNIKAFVQLMTVEVLGAIDKVVAYAEYLNTAISDFSFDGATAQLEADLDRINSVRVDSIGLILKENESAKESFDGQIRAAKQLRLEYDQLKASAPSSQLGQFKIQAEGDDKLDPKGEKSLSSARDATQALQRELDLRRGISQIYRDNELSDTAGQHEKERSLQKINEQTKLAESEAKYAEDTARRQERFLASLENDALEDEQKTAIRQAFADQEAIAAQIRQENLNAIESEGAAARDAIAKAEMQSRLSNAQQLGGALISLGQGQSRKVFKIGQKLALAQAAAALPSAVLQSFQNGGGYPWGLVPAGAMLATGLANINNIRKAGSGMGGGGGGSVPSISLPSGGTGGAPAPQTQTASSIESPEPQQSVMVVPRYDDDEPVQGAWVNRLMDAINEQQRNGKVLIRGES